MQRALDSTDIVAQLDAEGYAVLPRAFAPDQARELAAQVDTLKSLHRVSLNSIDLGLGNMLRFASKLPAPWATWRDALYRGLAPVANHWNEALGVKYRYPAELEAFLLLNREAGQTQPLSHLNRLGAGDYLALHQSNEGDHVFPLQVVALLSEPGKDFHGGEFVLTEQRPRMQSRPMVLPLGLGDMAIISTAKKPFKGGKGFYRVNLKHAISRVHRGERIGVELSFHDAP
ncbi:2OG-Fe(II) oxygenase [Paraburkholderia pallida]|uniref:Prolyl 4-hydroxylase n=1 Tax=Paraburkholderia pallida TaxID=2547399 RepID=A0A4P7CX67_9BURK|nr:2OG-Fe(II) oxygenase [Paraburkholderia pallida]QBR00819.1 prolyl 4-hydroxylase [Paraburkholderia pallida]